MTVMKAFSSGRAVDPIEAAPHEIDRRQRAAIG